MRGTIIFTLITAINKEVEKTESEIVKPTKSVPSYEEYFPRFKKIIAPIEETINNRKITFIIKTFNDDNLIIEAITEMNEERVSKIHELKNILFNRCKEMIQQYNPSSFFEEYIFFCISDYDMTDRFVKKKSAVIASLLKDETAELTQKEIQETISSQIRYAKNDINIVEWDGAFLLDKEKQFKDTIAILELANIQLLNLRILDNKLQEELIKIKDITHKASFMRIFTRSKDLHYLIRVRTKSLLEFDAIENSLKLYGDWYSAKVYSIAAKKLYIEKWKTIVEKKLDTVRELYTMIAQRTSESYNLLLEFTIVLLIVFEIALAFMR